MGDTDCSRRRLLLTDAVKLYVGKNKKFTVTLDTKIQDSGDRMLTPAGQETDHTKHTL